MFGSLDSISSQSAQKRKAKFARRGYLRSPNASFPEREFRLL
jgi:hypothetical protein